MTTLQLDLRRVVGAFPTGVAALAAVVDGGPVGMVASSFTSVSLEPPLVSACVAHTSATWPTLRRATRIGVSVLGVNQEHVSRRMAAKGVDRFVGLDRRTTADGCVLLGGSAAWFDCTIDQEVRAGDHDIVVLRVHDLGFDPGVEPLVFHASTYRRLG